jgi:hypothetical protein
VDIPVVGPVLGFVGLKHEWLRTPTKEAGLGQAGGGIPGQGPYRLSDNLPYVTQTEVTNHAGRGIQPGAVCKTAPGVKPSCVNPQLTIGQQKGRWTLSNQCQTFVNSVIRTCQQPSPASARDKTAVAPRSKSE